MAVETFTSHSHTATQAFGAQLAAQLQPGDLLAFYGDLGAGKTCMIQGICQALEVKDQVNSPTFIIINEYLGKLAGLTIPIYHFDLYRLNSSAELEDLGAEEYFYSKGICLIEWPERAADLLPAKHSEVRLEYISADQRRITLRQMS